MANGVHSSLLDGDSIVEFKPAVRDAEGNLVSHGTPVAIKLSELAAYIGGGGSQEITVTLTGDVTGTGSGTDTINITTTIAAG